MTDDGSKINFLYDRPLSLNEALLFHVWHLLESVDGTMLEFKGKKYRVIVNPQRGQIWLTPEGALPSVYRLGLTKME